MYVILEVFFLYYLCVVVLGVSKGEAVHLNLVHRFLFL